MAGSSDDHGFAATVAAGSVAGAAVDPDGATLPPNDATLASISGAPPPRTKMPSLSPDDQPLGPVDPAAYIRGKVLAMGGMGRIVAAHDRRLGRPVALKEVRADNAELRSRFTREVKLTARLQHPNIITVHEAGTWPNGEPFFAMKLVAGRSLDKVVAERSTLEARLALLPSVIAVADALAYAHRERVIHRDLKPANVLVGDFGETVVIDWGLAKDLAATGAPAEEVPATPYRASAGESNGETAYGAIIGTPAYMPPEQARGEPVDERADVYALGALLYHVLCGRPPVDGNSLDELLSAVISKPIVTPRTRDARIPLELDTIITKAMSPEPADRYPSAVELAEDLRRFQTGQLVGAHHYTTWQLVARWVHRRRTPLAIAAIALVVLAGGGTIAVRNVVAERDRAARSTRSLLVEEGRREYLDRYPLRALALLDAARELGESSPELDFLLGRVLPFATSAVQRYTLPAANLTTVAFGPDEKHVLTTSTDGHVQIWDAAAGTLVRDVQVGAAFDTIVLGPTETRVIALHAGLRGDPYAASSVDLTTGSGDAASAARLVAFDMTGSRVWRVGETIVLDHDGQREALAGGWSGDILGARARGADLLVVTRAEIVHLHDDGHAIAVVTNVPLDDVSFEHVEISADLSRLFAYGRGSLKLVTPDGQTTATFTDRDVSVATLRDDGTQVAYVDGQNRLVIRKWEPESMYETAEALGRAVATPPLSCRGRATELHYSADGHSLVVACADTQILVVDPETSNLRATFTAEVDTLAVAISHDGTRVIAVLRDGAAELWSTAATRDLRQLSGPYTCAVFDAHDGLIAFREVGVERAGTPGLMARDTLDSGCTADAAGHFVVRYGVDAASQPQLKVYDLTGPTTAEPVRVMPLPERIELLAMSPDGRRVMVTTKTNQVIVFEGTQRIATWPVPPGLTKIDELVFDARGDHVLQVNADARRVEVVEVSTGAVTGWSLHDVTRAQWSPDGSRIVTNDGQTDVAIWQPDGTLIARFPHTAPVNAIAVSSDNAEVVTASDDGNVRRWRASTGELIAQLRVSHGELAMLALDPRGGRFATAARSGEVALWSADGEQLELLLTTDDPDFQALAFSATGERLLVVPNHGSVAQWDTSLATAVPPAEIRRLVDRFVPWVVVDGRVEPRALAK